MDSAVVRDPAAKITFTLLEPDLEKGAGQIDDFLAKHEGAGVQHVAFLVDDLIAAVLDYRDHGIDFVRTPAAYYELLTQRIPGMREEISDLRSMDILADQDEWGAILQLFTRSPYPRRTLFYELIERRGARGFGSSNIRALYEAVERERSADR
jgi:4-hydroxymandelate synthase